MKLGFVISRAASLDTTWTTVHLAVAALARGDSVRFIEPWDFEVDSQGRLIARAHAFDSPESAAALVEALQQRSAPRRYVDLRRLDVLMLRSAPLNPSLLAFASLARDLGVRVVNDPDGLVRVTHKAWLASLPGAHVPPSVVTRSKASARLFFQGEPHGVIVKPARGSGGRGVERVLPHRTHELETAFDAAMEHGDGYVVVQRYLPEAAAGEKRLVWLDGEVLGGYLRRRAAGEFRHNLKRGATAEPTDVTPTDRAIIQTVSGPLLQAGIRLAGLDLIGEWLIEVNVLNPGGAYHTDRLAGTDLADLILTRLCRPLEHESPWVPRVP